MNKLLITLFFFYSMVCFPSEKDSLFIEEVLSKSMTMDFSTNDEKILFFAGEFQGKPYKGGTLDICGDERLIIRTDSFDCTTYVETVMALFIASKEKEPKFGDFYNALLKLRYRNGILDGYLSRLHYFSDWVCDNSQKGLVEEITCKTQYEIRKFSIDFMTEHYNSYNVLKLDTSLLEGMRLIERKWKDYEMPYIPKTILDSDRSLLEIDNGDILALTTDIKGLDVVHLGFAIWINGKIHLLHASSVSGRVILDDKTLYCYLKNKPKHTGIRVIRIR